MLHELVIAKAERLIHAQTNVAALRRMRGLLFLACAALSFALFLSVSLVTVDPVPTMKHSVWILGIIFDFRLLIVGLISIIGALGIGTFLIEIIINLSRFDSH